MRQLFATGAGIFAIFNLSSASSSTLVMKLPLDGNVSGTKVLATQGGVNVTLTFSKVTSGSNMASGTNTTFAFTSNPSAFYYMQLTGGTTGGNGSAPTTAGTPSKTVTNL